MRPAEFAAISGERSFRCSLCDKIHTWTAQTAWLFGAERETAPLEEPALVAS